MNKTFFFDLDGTLMDTLPDIKDAVNDALKELSLPLCYELNEVKTFIGRGAEVLAHKALKEYDEQYFSSFLKAYYPLYHSYQGRNTYPYKGMKETLEVLKNQGCSLFVVTNKPDAFAKELIARHLPNLFLDVQGYVDGYPPKPDPWFISSLVKKYKIQKKDAVFVGDSLPDLETAERANLPLILCSYGYGEYTSSLCARASKIIKTPNELLGVL